MYGKQTLRMGFVFFSIYAWHMKNVQFVFLLARLLLFVFFVAAVEFLFTDILLFYFKQKLRSQFASNRGDLRRY